MSDANLPAEPPREGQFLLYQTEDGQTRIECRLQHESLWLTQKDLAELFQVSVKTVNEHLGNIYNEGELPSEATLRKFRIVQTEGTRPVSRDIAHYNLDAIISVGYRVRSQRGTQFRIWATERLREYLVKGFTMDDARLKQAGGGNYFEELLARIRDIRSSERVFWRKVLDIYATSIDYDPSDDASLLFFRTVQNKMHWAAPGRRMLDIRPSHKTRRTSRQTRADRSPLRISHPQCDGLPSLAAALLRLPEQLPRSPFRLLEPRLPLATSHEP